MSETEQASRPSLRRHPWPSARILWAALGALGLVAASAGVYLSTSTRNDGSAAPADSGLGFRAHPQPRPVPEVLFEDGQGRQRALAQFRGKVVLLNLWATWCVPCREEMPALDRLQQRLGGPGFEVLALSIDADGASAVKRFYDEMGIRALAVYVDPTMRATGALGAPGIPTTLLIDHQGREIGRRSGAAQWDGEDALRLISGYVEATDRR